MPDPDFRDYYAALGVPATAKQDEIKRAYRKLARKYHPDVSKEPDAESRFKEVAEAHEALIDPQRRAAYDDLVWRRSHEPRAGAPRTGPAQRGMGSTSGFDGYEFDGRGMPGGQGLDGADADFSDFFASLFGRAERGGPSGHPGDLGGAGGPVFGSARAAAHGPRAGADHHARLAVTLGDLYSGARRTITLRRPAPGADRGSVMAERQVEVDIPRGLRPGQHLRLAGQGEPGSGGAPAGDLYLEIALQQHDSFRVDGADVWFDLPVAPWEAALGASVSATTPDGQVSLTIPAASGSGRKLRLKGKGLPGQPPGDLYAVLVIHLPPADTPAARAAWGALQQAFAGYAPRGAASTSAAAAPAPAAPGSAAAAAAASPTTPHPA